MSLKHQREEGDIPAKKKQKDEKSELNFELESSRSLFCVFSFETLNRDIQDFILSFLDHKGLLAVKNTSKKMHALCASRINYTVELVIKTGMALAAKQAASKLFRPEMLTGLRIRTKKQPLSADFFRGFPNLKRFSFISLLSHDGYFLGIPNLLGMPTKVV
eukprot:TRINITY_DN20059_c0_g1_i1.p1 TRINITY_DN20059_c0_g1~~TRINITY_DN20059_c0_g1_i1.p1  ORF type:complete len:161 (-),score=5.31 TRINITY_DN20059_c0_g1_i1:53-535(-)